MAVYFIYNNYINFIYTWGNFDQPIKDTPTVIKVTPSTIKVTPLNRVTKLILIGLWFRISSKKLIIPCGKGIELKANYHSFKFSSGGLCDVAYFQNFQETSKINHIYPVSTYIILSTLCNYIAYYVIDNALIIRLICIFSTCN